MLKLLYILLTILITSSFLMACDDNKQEDMTTAQYIAEIKVRTETNPAVITLEESKLSGRTHYCTKYEIWLMEQVVQVETGGSYFGSYYETATILNRLDLGWADSIEAVCYQEGQYPACQFGWLDNEISIETAQAVRDCIANNDTPIDLVYADSRHNYEGTDEMIYYCSFDGQDFYISR